MIDEVCFSAALLEGAQEVFSTMVFMDIEESSDPDQQIGGDSLMGSITFSKGIEGCMVIRCSLASARAIAADMLGLDGSDELSEGEVCDAIGEITNMVMGSVKSRIQTETGELAVSIPTVVRGEKLESSLGDGAGKVFVKVNAEEMHVIEFLLMYREAGNRSNKCGD